MGVGQQLKYDTVKTDGGAVYNFRRFVQNNPPDSPYTPTANDYGCLGWTLDPKDILTAAQTAVSQTLYGSLLIVPNSGTVNRLSFSPHTVQATQTNFNGVALFQMNAAGTALTQVAVSANQTWTGVTPDGITDAAFSTTPTITPGYYWGVFLGSTSGTAMTLHGANASSAAALNFSKASGAANQVSKWTSFTLAAQTSMPASITLSGTTPSAFVPFLALS